MMRTAVVVGLWASSFLSVCPPLHAGIVLTGADRAQLETWLGYSIETSSLYSADVLDDHTGADFHAAVDGQGPTLLLLEVRQGDEEPLQLVGGFNPQDWSTPANSSLPHVGFVVTEDDADRTAFIFNLSTSVRFDQKLGPGDGKYQTFVGEDNLQLPGFGLRDLVVADTFTRLEARVASYGPNDPGEANILGQTTAEGAGDWTIVDFEVFSVSPAVVPEPATSMVWSMLGFCVIGGAWTRRYFVSAKR